VCQAVDNRETCKMCSCAHLDSIQNNAVVYTMTSALNHVETDEGKFEIVMRC
jgi:hypothetical protein